MVRQTSQHMYYTNSHRTNREKAAHIGVRQKHLVEN